MEYGDTIPVLQQMKKELAELGETVKDIDTVLAKYVMHRNAAISASGIMPEQEHLERGLAEHYQAIALYLVLEQHGYTRTVNETYIKNSEAK